MLDFRYASDMLRLTMTDKLHYQDVFTTINIPKPERRLAMKAKNLFDVAVGTEPWNPAVFTHLSRATDSINASQAFWDYENEDGHTYDRLALTIMQRGLTIALEHRDFDQRDARIRQTMLVSQGVSKVYTSDLLGRPDMGETGEQAVTAFKENFLLTTANLGLYSRIQQLRTDQNESDSAIFASAA